MGQEEQAGTDLVVVEPSNVAVIPPRRKGDKRPEADIKSEAAERYIERLVALHEQKAEVATDIKEVKSRAKDDGFDPAALMIVVKRKMETPEERAAREAVEWEADAIMARLGMLADTPLGEAAIRKRG